MVIMAMLLSRPCPIMDLRNVLIRQRALNDLSGRARGCRDCGSDRGISMQNWQHVMEAMRFHVPIFNKVNP